jgi:hypothetical protein
MACFVVPPDVAVAVMLALPAATPVTTPVVAFTDAMPGAADDHVTVAAIGLPFWSRGLAVNASVEPTFTLLPPEIVTDVNTGAGAAVTVICTELVTVTLPATAEAVIVAVPVATPVTRPLVALTLATVGADELHVTVAAMAVPFWSLGDAVSCVVVPATMLVAGAVMVTEVRTAAGGGAVTVICTVLVTVTPPATADAVMVAVPAATPVTRPLVALTPATAGADELHVTVAAMAVPFWSLGDAVSCVVVPATMLVAGAVMVTVVSAGAATTRSCVLPLTLALPAVAVAVIVTRPGPAPVTRPDALTVAIDCDELLHATVAEKAAPFWSLGVADSCSVCPATSDCAGALTATELRTAAGGGV